MSYEPVIDEEIDTLLAELKELQHKEFMVQMIDHWTQEDYKYDRELWDKIKDIKQTLKERYGLEEGDYNG